MSVFESIDRPPVEYLPTGDKALLIAWAIAAIPGEIDPEPLVILCLEDGRAVRASISEIKFDYRYSNRDQKWYDVSRIDDEEELDADPDQGDADDGSPSVPGLVPQPD